MKRILYVLAFALLLANVAYAGPIDIEAAKQIAQDYLKKQTGARKSIKHTVAPRRASATTSANGAESPAYYIFDIEDNSGFVIISGDDALKPVLAHTDNGNFNADNLNPAVQWWLGLVEENVATVRATPEQSAANRAASYEFESSVSPLIITKWNQAEPYNELCPYDDVCWEQSLTGCVATAMAQILNYYKYPSKATGSISYNAYSHDLSIKTNLDDYIFDWDKMLNSYTNSSPQDARTAVAELMYACAVSVYADFCGKGTSASSSRVASSLEKHFGYKGAYVLNRYYYTAKEWNDIIMTELNGGSPVYYSASNAIGEGHAFICDGYNQSGLFHINWGWGGSQDGYFELASLKYPLSPYIICGINPQNEAPANVCTIAFSNFGTPSKTKIARDRISATLYKIMNVSSNDFKGFWGLALMSGDEILAYEYDNTVITLSSSYYKGSRNFVLDVPADIPDGKYRIVGIYKEIDSDETKLMRTSMENGNIGCLNISLEGDCITFIETENAVLEVTNIEYPGYIENDDITEITFTLKNSTNSDFRGYVYINSMENSMGVYVPSGVEKTYTVPYSTPKNGDNCKLNLYSYNDILGSKLIYTHIIEIVSGVAPDFEAGGIYYKITNKADKIVYVTHKGADKDEYMNEYEGDITIPATVDYNGETYNVKGIASDAFYDCYSLRNITIPYGITHIGKNAFNRCISLLSVSIPASVTTIDQYAFYGCSCLASVSIPTSVTTIGVSAFSRTAITSINIPNSVNKIYYNAFDNCKKLAEITVESGNTVYDSRDNCNAIIETATNTLVTGCMNTVIPNSVMHIGFAAFNYCYNLTTITIPKGVVSMGRSAFKSCYSLEEIYLRTRTPLTIDSSTFGNVPATATLYVPTGTKALYEADVYWGNFANIVEMEFGDDEITGIEPVVADYYTGGADVIYDFQGHRIAEPVKGCIYIKNNRKFIAE